MGRKTTIESRDGFKLGAYEARPTGKPKGAVVVIQEIFGVNAHIREVCDGYAKEGYVALAPQIFDRVERDIELGYGPDDMTRGIGIARGKLKMDQTLADLQAAIEVAATSMLGGALLTRPAMDDRSLPASDVLAAL